MKKDDYFSEDLVGAIEKQLKDIDITHIEISPINTATDPNYYSHVEEVKGIQKDGRQNWVGFITNKKREVILLLF